MTIPASHLHDLPILGLDTSEPVGKTVKPVVRMDNLQVVALRCSKLDARGNYLLLTADIRQLSPEYLIINDTADLVELGDVIRLREIVETNFDPIGKTVIGDQGLAYGTVRDYTIDGLTSLITSITVTPRLFSGRGNKPTTINREQIVDVTPKRIIVQDPTELEQSANSMLPDAAA